MSNSSTFNKLRTGFIGLLCASITPLGATYAQDDASIEEVIVTGSRLLDTESSVSPVTVIDTEDLLERPADSVTTYLQENLTSNYSVPDLDRESINNGGIRNGGNRQTSVDLRGLGSQNTLVLINGKRTIEYPAFNRGDGWRTVDLNSTMPAIALRNIQILSDGGTAIYGSDAVAGVVNVVPDYQFEGARIQVRSLSHASAIGSPDSTVSAIFGGGNDDTNIIFAAEYRTADWLDIYETEQAQTFADPAEYPEWWNDNVNQDQTGMYTYVPVYQRADGTYAVAFGRMRIPGVRRPVTSPRSSTFADPLCGDSTALGIDPISVGYMSTPDGGHTIGTGGAAVPTLQGSTRCHMYRYGNENLTSQIDRDQLNVFTAVTHDFSDNLRFTAEFGYNTRRQIDYDPYQRGDQWIRRGGTITDLDRQLIMPIDHPAIRYYVETYGLDIPSTVTDQSAGPPRVYPVAGIAPTEMAFASFNRKLEGFNNFEQIRGAFDLEWAINDDWTLDIGYVLAENSVENSLNRMHMDRARRALMGYGGVECSPTAEHNPGIAPGSTGCEYWNPTMSAALPNAEALGLANSDALQRWMTVADTSIFSSDFEDISAILSGTLPFELAGGPVGLAVGVGQRTDMIDVRRSHFTSEAALAAQEIGATDIAGQITNDSIFFELVLPVAEALTIQAAGRREESSVGFESFDPKIGINWAATDAITVRGSWGTSFRSPTIIHAEDILIQERRFMFTEDIDIPRVGITGNPDPQNPGNPNNFRPANYQINSYQVGNPNIQPQTATNVTVGTDIQLSDLFGMENTDQLSLSLHYISVEFEDLIRVATGTARLRQDECHFRELEAFGTSASPAGRNNSIWELIPTNPEVNGIVPTDGECFIFDTPAYDPTIQNNPIAVYGTSLNLAGLNTDSLDISLNYGADTPIGYLTARPSLTYLLSLEVTEEAGGPTNDAAGQTGVQFVPRAPEIRANMRMGLRFGGRGQHSVNLTPRYISAVDTVAGDTIDAALTWDVNYILTVADTFRVSGSINNLTNEIDDELGSIGSQLPRYGRRLGLQLAYDF